jgi:hypothetical protein
MIVCTPKCRKDVGDGFCDEHNNNKHCRWDGGDCCLSTSRGRLVIRVPPNCRDGCDCKDPNAIENTRKAPSPGSGAGLGQMMKTMMMMMTIKMVLLKVMEKMDH